MDTRMRARRALGLDLRDALAKGEFELYYQPSMDIQRGAIGGCEALLRWQVSGHIISIVGIARVQLSFIVNFSGATRSPYLIPRHPKDRVSDRADTIALQY